MIELQFRETKFGTVLINPLSDDILTLNEKTQNKFNKLHYDILMYGEGYLDLGDL